MLLSACDLQLYRKRQAPTQQFYCEFWEILSYNCFGEHLRRVASELCQILLVIILFKLVISHDLWNTDSSSIELLWLLILSFASYITYVLLLFGRFDIAIPILNKWSFASCGIVWEHTHTVPLLKAKYALC